MFNFSVYNTEKIAKVDMLGGVNLEERKEQKKRFSDWESVDCNNCEAWWMNTCDGVPEGSTRHCNGFKATRSVILPAKLEALRKAFRSLTAGVIILGALVGVLISAVGYMFWCLRWLL